MSRLFIAEKPDIARAMASYLWPDGSYAKNPHFFKKGDTTVTWAFGHILRLAEPNEYPEFSKNRGSYPLFPQKWKIVPREDAKEQLSAIGKLLKENDTVVNGGDADREGQLLVDEILQYFNYKGHVLRIFINAKDDVSLRRAFNSIQENTKFYPLYLAGLAREKADWLVGMNLSRAYTACARRSGYPVFAGFSFRIGRVKMPTLALVVQRYLEIKNFKRRKFFELGGVFTKDGKKVPVSFVQPEDFGKQDSEGRILERKCLDDIVSELANVPGIVKSVKKQKTVSQPPLPHSLDTLQVAANKAYGYSPNEVLDTVQKLYEMKFVTYPRSDCNYLPESQKEDAPVIISNLRELGFVSEAADADPSYLESRCWNDKKVSTHTALAPTLEKPNPHSFDTKQRDIYYLIASRYCLQFYKNHEEMKTSYLIQCGKYEFKGTGSTILVNGFKGASLSLAGEGAQDIRELPEMKEGDSLGIPELLVKDKFTTPPKPFTEGTLLAAMSNIYKFVDKDNPMRDKLKEIHGIGTPATRAKIIEDLLASRLGGREVKAYMVKRGKDLYPTEFGLFTIQHIHNSLSLPDTTAKMEYELNELSQDASKEQSIRDGIISMVKENIQYADSITFPPLKDAVSCPLCGKGNFVEFHSKNSKQSFFLCSNTDCKDPATGKPFFWPAYNDAPVVIKCPTCNKGYLTLTAPSKKTGKKYWVCASCHTFYQDTGKGKPGEALKKAAPPEDSGILCPVCGKEHLMKHKASSGRVYYVCADNDCKVEGKTMYYDDSNGKPIIAKCSDCNTVLSHLVSKKTGKPFFHCSHCDKWYTDTDGKPVPFDNAPVRSADSVTCPVCKKGFLVKYISSKTNKPFYVCSDKDCSVNGKKVFYDEKDGKPLIALCAHCKDVPLSHVKSKKSGKYFFLCQKCGTWYADEDGKAVPLENKKPERPKDAVTCPVCKKGFLVRHVSKNKKVFYVCSEHDCKQDGNMVFYDELNGKPLIAKCPECDAVLSHNYSKKTGAPFFKCPSCGNFYDDKNGKPVKRSSGRTRKFSGGRKLK